MLAGKKLKATVVVKKSSGPVIIQAFLSSFCFFIILVALVFQNEDAILFTEVGATSDHSPPSAEISSASPAATESSSTIQHTPKRGKFIGSDYDARDLYSAYKEIQSEYHEKAFSKASQTEWKILENRDGAEVSMMEHPSDPNCPYVRMTIIIPTEVQECWDFLSLKNWEESMPDMDPFYEGVELHGEFVHKKVHMILARKLTQRILAFGRRDFVFLSVSDEPLKDGTWVSGTVSVQTPKIPRQKGYTRAFQDSIAFYKPIDNGTKTKITMVFRIDLNDSSENGSGGLMPMWLYVKTVGNTGARSVISMRNVLMEAKQRRQQQKQKLGETPAKKVPFWKKVRPFQATKS